MAFKCEILADSISEAGARLTTMQLTYPRCIHAEFMTHRVFSRNAASSRAIPFEKATQMVLDDPYIPEWGLNEKGMQSTRQLGEKEKKAATEKYLGTLYETVRNVRELAKLNIHKQDINRILEPWAWITTICSATEWDNFFELRCHKDAHPAFQKIAYMMQEKYSEGKPELLESYEWHLPLAEEFRITGAVWECEQSINSVKISVGRCARVSYLTHDGKKDPDADVELHNRLLISKHWSPFEHVARPCIEAYHRSGNFFGWQQYREIVCRPSSGNLGKQKLDNFLLSG